MENYPVEFQYLIDLIRYRLCRSLEDNCSLAEPQIPATGSWGQHIAAFIDQYQIDRDSSILLLIGLSPHIYPHLFDDAIGNRLDNQSFPKMGGTNGKNFRGFLPTGETAFFVLAGEEREKRSSVQILFNADHVFAEKKVLWLETLPEGEPPFHGRIIMSPDYVDILTSGKHLTPHFSMSFPARLVQTNLDWSDLVISDELKDQINELKTWLKYHGRLASEWGMGDRFKKGYLALFYGPSGTGKTFTAGLLGKEVKKDVYKIDLSMVISKYIGETEKNLEALFARAEDKGWILFFDEADALFGKRTNVREAHDKYANQEVSYLLQRIEDFSGMVILATNMKNNIDEAFLRRFNAVLKFSLPETEERAKIWKNSFPVNAKFFKKHVPITADEDGSLYSETREEVSVPDAVKKYQLTGGSIINVVHYASLKAMERMHADKTGASVPATAASGSFMEIQDIPDSNPPMTVYLTDVLDGIKKELLKAGKPFA